MYHASKSDLKCEDRPLTRWQKITYIVVIIERNSCNKVPGNYLGNEKYFLEFPLDLLNIHKILSILKTKISFITSRFPELVISKNVVTWMPESSCFGTPFGSKRGKGSQTLLKSPRQLFYVNFPFMSDKVTCVSCLLVRSEMWGSSFNTLTADHMDSCHNREKFLEQVAA